MKSVLTETLLKNPSLLLVDVLRRPSSLDAVKVRQNILVTGGFRYVSQVQRRLLVCVFSVKIAPL